MKKRWILLLCLSSLLALQACAPAQTKEQAPQEKTQTEQKTQAQEEQMLELSLEELSKFNGKDGAKAYVAVDGVIYDVTLHPAWKDGGHQGFEAGQDITEAIKTKSPHGISKLEGLKAVGKLK